MKPSIGLILGDPNGIGPEIVAKLLAQPDIAEKAKIIIIGDYPVFQMAEQIAGTAHNFNAVEDFSDIDLALADPIFLDIPTIAIGDVTLGYATASAGRSVLKALTIALELAQDKKIDAICFAPLNKQAMHLAGSPFEDELHFFADKLGVTTPFRELNVLDQLWTSRVTSHIALSAVSQNITQDAVIAGIELVHHTLRRAGLPSPRIAVAALNPHGGEGGLFGREEIDIIQPAVQLAQERDIDAAGPFPSDTVFLKARDGQYDAVVTMYHDQGQIAMKLMGFERGVTVHGGLPVPIATPAHGTAFDIVGQGVAKVSAITQAFYIACQMATTLQSM